MSATLPQSSLRIAIACGGTGGHLFPGIAVGHELRERGCNVSLMISEKEVDQLGARGASDLVRWTLPAVGLVHGGTWAFLRAFASSYRISRRWFAEQRPVAVLAMGGFTSAPPALAARRIGAPVFLHESNAIPGRANRWLSHLADEIFVGFADAGKCFRKRQVTVTGTPVRAEFKPADSGSCRAALGLDPAKPVLLVMGGSQGATAVNRLALGAICPLAEKVPGLQVVHLAGQHDASSLRHGYSAANLPAMVVEFMSRMELALGAATVALSRGGASSLAELAAVGVPALVVPYPTAVDDHQLLNARALESSGACLVLEEKSANSERLVSDLQGLFTDAHKRDKMKQAMGSWHFPASARTIAERILSAVRERPRNPQKAAFPPGSGRHLSAVA